MGAGAGKKMVTKKQSVLLPDIDYAGPGQLADPDASEPHVESRQARIDAIRKQVEAGTYVVDSLAVARAVVKRSVI